MWGLRPILVTKPWRFRAEGAPERYSPPPMLQPSSTPIPFDRSHRRATVNWGKLGTRSLTQRWAAILAHVAGGTLTLAMAAAPFLPPAWAHWLTTAEAATTNGTVSSWLTTADQSALLQAQPAIRLTPDAGSLPAITVDDTRQGQQMVGFGASMTDSSAWLIASRLSPAQRSDLMNHLFSPNNAGLSYLRQPIGASDFALRNYTYDDMPPGQTDYAMAHFSTSHDNAYIIPTIQQALSLNPGLSITGTPWSPPAWMRSGQTMSGTNGGTLDADAYSAYASYLQHFVAAYQSAGLRVSVLTVQNEPLAQPAYPGMRMTPGEEANFIAGYLGPAFKRAGISTGIVAYDHNWDHPDYANAVLASPSASPYIDGSAFHCYAGSPSGQLTTHNAYPTKNIYLTECSGGAWAPNFGDDLNWDTSNLVIDGTRNWARAVATWNIALDAGGGPHFSDGNQNDACQNCRGVVTIDAATGHVTYNVEYYVLGQASKAADPGAVRVQSNDFGPGRVRNVAFKNPDGSIGMVVLNNAQTPQSFQVSNGGESFDYNNLPVKAVVTFRWFPTGARGAMLNRDGWTATASSTSPWDATRRSIDGSEATRWSSGQAQRSGDYFQVDMGATQSFSQITMDTGPSSTGDYPRSYAVHVSQDGSNWGPAVALGAGSGQVTTIDFATQTARFVRITQTGSSGWWWSIAEFNAAR